MSLLIQNEAFLFSPIICVLCWYPILSILLTCCCLTVFITYVILTQTSIYKYNIKYNIYFNLGSRSPPEILFSPVHVRLGAQVTIKCKPNRDSIYKLTTILIKDPSSTVIVRAARLSYTNDPFILMREVSGVDSNLIDENGLPMISVNFSRPRIQNAGNYTCVLQFADGSSIETVHYLLVWGVHLFLICYFMNIFQASV